MYLRLRCSVTTGTLFLLAILAGCGTLPTKEELANLDYGSCPENYAAKIKAVFQDGTLYSYSGDPIIYPPRKYWYKESALKGGRLYVGYLVPVTVDIKRRGLEFNIGKQTYGLLFKNNELVKTIYPDNFRLLAVKDLIGPLPKDDRDWEIGFSDAKGSPVIMEWALPGETVQNWSELITHQAFLSVPTDMSHERLMQGARTQTEKDCRNVKWTVISQSPEEVFFERHASECAPIRDEYAIEKLVQGVRSLNQIAYARNSPFSDTDRKKWLDIMAKVKLSDECT